MSEFRIDIGDKVVVLPVLLETCQAECRNMTGTVTKMGEFHDSYDVTVLFDHPVPCSGRGNKRVDFCWFSRGELKSMSRELEWRPGYLLPEDLMAR